MIEALLTIYANNLDYAKRLVRDLPDERIAHQPAPNMNHPVWVIGHLAQVADRVACGFILQMPRQMPEGLDPLFGGKSVPVPDRATYPDMAALMGYLDEAHRRVTEKLRASPEALLEARTPHEGFGRRFPTIGLALTHVLIGHEQLHLGQLSAWRRALGLPPV